MSGWNPGEGTVEFTDQENELFYEEDSKRKLKNKSIPYIKEYNSNLCGKELEIMCSYINSMDEIANCKKYCYWQPAFSLANVIFGI